MRLALAIVAVSAGVLLGEPAPWENPQRWLLSQRKDRSLENLGDAALRAKLREGVRERKEQYWPKDGEFDALLTEISRRGGGAWVPVLEESRRGLREGADDPAEPGGSIHDLEILATLRRVQGRRQPLRISVPPTLSREWEFPALPAVDLTVGRDRAEPEDFWFTFGGNYRTGRQARWSVLVWNDEGRLLPRRERFGSFGGGIFRRGTIGNDVWETTLHLNRYLQGEVPVGTYHACIVYHDAINIADETDLGDYVLTCSDAFEFEVTGRLVKPLPIKMEELEGLVRSLPRTGTVKVLSATYGIRWFEFIDPKSPAGELLSIGWPVVPGLVDVLTRVELTSTQRAWGLGILHSIAGYHDPTNHDDVVGAYTKHSGGFWIQNRLNGEWAGSGGGLGGRESSSGGEMDEDAQRRLLKSWEQLVGNLAVVKE